MAYMDENSDINFSSLIITLIILVIWGTQQWKTFIGTLALCYSFLVYLKYQFMEINQLIENSLKKKNVNSLLNAILRHKSVEQTVHELNKMYKILVFLVYLTSVPAIDISIYVFNRDDSSAAIKAFGFTIGLIVIAMVFTINYMCAQIIRTAHKSRPLLYSFLIENKLPVNQ